MSVAIYGAGVYGKIAYQYYEKLGENILFFIVSDKRDDYVDGIKVRSVSELKNETGDNFSIIVAVDKRYWLEIEEAINDNLKLFDKKKITWLKRDEIQQYNRIANPIKVDSFLSTTKPVSRLFGTDRGTPIDRYYIEKFLESKSKKISNVGITLEVGEDTYSKRYFPSATHDVLFFQKGMDLTKLETLPKSKYDVFICTQTFHEIYNIREAINGAKYILKDEGVLLATVAGNISQVATYDMKRHGDYWRFTDKSIKMLIQEVFDDEVEVTAFGNIMAATAFIQGVALEEINTALLDEIDSDYSICIGIVARKR